MAHSPNIAPNRRRSIAVLNIDSSKSHQSRTRRAHSIAPGDKLSPYTKSRRSLGPRKSILKQAHKNDDDVTQTMELTTANPGISRRVSFAASTHVRLFEVQEQNTNSTGTPSSSPSQDSIPPPSVNDENAYPGANKFSRSRRRSSIRRSFGTDIGGEQSMELDMDDTAPSPFSLMQGGDKLLDEDFDEERSDYDDDMDFTEIVRRRSMGRRRSSMGPQLLDDASLDNSDISASVEGHPQEHTEYMIPLGKSLREPSPPPDEWHALRAITHAGNTSVTDPPEAEKDDDGSMDLGDAMSRLRAARDSLGLVGYLDGNALDPSDSEGQEDIGFKEASFTSTDSESFDVGIAHDKTLNLTDVLRRESFIGSSQESTLNFGSKGRPFNTSAEDAHINKAVHLPAEKPLYPDLSEFTNASQSTPMPPQPVSQKSFPSNPDSTVFSRPLASTVDETLPSSTPKTASTSQPTRPLVFSSKVKAANKPSISPSGTSEAPVESLKRPISPTGDTVERPSPAKKQVTSRLSFRNPTGPPSSTGLPIPKKTTPFSSRKSSSPVKRRVSSTSGMRRASVTFAQQSSIGGPAGVAFGSRVTTQIAKVEGRKSVQGNLGSPSKANPPLKIQTGASGPASETPTSPSCERESVRQAIAVPSPSRGSPMPDPTRITSPRPQSPRQTWPKVDLDAREHPAAQENRTERWREDVPDDDLAEDDDEPPISIDQFLAMTGVKFMDELAAPRRSTILPSLLASSTSSEHGGDVPLADYVISMSDDLPQWILYADVSKDLQGMVDGIKEFYKEAEKDVEKDVPALFREFASADDDLKEELLHQLKLIKANNHASARSQWYDWKLYWVSKFYETAEQTFSKLETDAATLEQIVTKTQELLPALREEYDLVMKDSEREAAEVTEIEQCDQEYLTELKTSIAEQSSELDVFRTEVAETTAKLDRMKERSAELEAEEREARASIAECERIIQFQMNSTKEEVFQLKEKMDALQELHLWRATKISPDMTQFTYASRYTVSIPCIKFVPVASAVTITRLAPPTNQRRDPFPHLSDLALKAAENQVSAMKDKVNHRRIIQFLSDFWTSLVQLRSQLDILTVTYPVSIENPIQDSDSSAGFKAIASVLFKKNNAKAFIKFVFDTETFSNWPMSLGSIRCEVEVAYGRLNKETICSTVLHHLSQVNVENLHGCLLNACVEAVERS